MAERNILAYFHSPQQAEGAKRKLEALRVIDVSIDTIGAYPGTGNTEILNPVTGDFGGLGELTLGGDFTDRSSAVLAAADPNASGMSDKGDEDIAGRNVLLTVVVNESDYEKAMTIVRQCGGLV
jgi:hypothetical protein